MGDVRAVGRPRRVRDGAGEPVILGAPPGGIRPAGERRTFDTTMKQALVEITGVAQHWEHTLLVERVSGSIWVTCDSDLKMDVEDLHGEQVSPLARDAPFPIPGRPFVLLPALTRSQLADVQVRGRALAEFHRAPLPPPGGVAAKAPVRDVNWFFADTAHPLFGAPVPLAVLAEADTTRLEASAGLVNYDEGGSDGRRWTYVEDVSDADYAGWLAEKRQGAGRDKRFLPIPSSTSAPLFRDVARDFTSPAIPNPLVFGATPSAQEEFTREMSASGLEPQGYALALISAVGIGAKSSSAFALKAIVFTLYLLGCRDGLNLSEISGAEHLARWGLQIVEAHSRNPRQPDYEGLEAYTEHMSEVGNLHRTGKFARHVADQQKVTSNILKQYRLAHEEAESEKKRRSNKKGEKGEGKGE